MNTVLPLPIQSITIIIVGYQSGSDLAELLPILVTDAPALGLEIILVDNDSSDNTKKIADRFKGEIEFIANKENVGFATAVNQALAISRSPYVLLLNPDARIDSDAIYGLKNYLDTHDKVAAVAPRLEFSDGSLQPSRGSFPTALRTIAHLFQLKQIMPADEKIINGPLRFLGRIFQQYSLPEQEQTVDYTTGACVLIRRSALDDVGELDPYFFLYYEEIDLAKRLAEGGYSWVFLNYIKVVHTVATSSEKAPLKPFLERYRSMCYYYSKHHPFWEAFLVRQALYIMIMIRWGLIKFNSKYRLDPDVPLQEELSVYRRLLFRRVKV